MYKEKYKKLPENHKNNQRQESSSLEPRRTRHAPSPKPAGALFRSPLAADYIQNHRSPPTTTGNDRLWPSHASSGRKLFSLSRVGHVTRRWDHHVRGFTKPDRKKPATTTEERVSRENQPKATDLAPKISPNFTRLDKTFARDTPRTTTPLNQLLV
jgi:hypothetical protein